MKNVHLIRDEFHFRLKGKSSDNQIDIDLKADLFQREGDISVTFLVPQLSIDEQAKVSYSLLESDQGDVKAYFNGKQYDLTWTPTSKGLNAQLKTPTIGYEDIKLVYEQVAGAEQVCTQRHLLLLCSFVANQACFFNIFR